MKFGLPCVRLSLLMISATVLTTMVKADDAADFMAKVQRAYADEKQCRADAHEQHAQCVVPCGGIYGNATCVNSCFKALKAAEGNCKATLDSVLQEVTQ